MDQFIPEIRAQSDPENVVLCLRIFHLPLMRGIIALLRKVIYKDNIYLTIL